MEPNGVTDWIETEFEVRYAETDAMGVVYYSNYLAWFEVGRGAFCRAYDINYRAIEEKGTLLAVVEAYCRYRAPARYGDRVRVRTRVAELKRATIRFEYEVLNADTNTPLAEGWTYHVWINKQGRPTSTPEALRGRLKVEDL